MNLSKKIVATTGFVALLAGCGGDQYGDLRQQLAQLTQNLRGHVPPLPQVKPYEAVPYKPEGKVDPFNPERINLAQAAAEQAGGRLLSPLGAVSSVVEPPTFNRLVVGPNPTRPSSFTLRPAL